MRMSFVGRRDLLAAAVGRRRRPSAPGPSADAVDDLGHDGVRCWRRSRPPAYRRCLNRSPRFGAQWPTSGGAPALRARRSAGPGTSWNRYGSASRPGWHTQHSPVRPVVTIVSTASAICSAGISGKSASAKNSLASSVRMLVSVMPGLTVFAVMPIGAQRRRDAADEADDRVLGQVVDRVRRERDEPGERAGGDDRAAAAPLHRPDRGPGAEDDAVDVHPHDPRGRRRR